MSRTLSFSQFVDRYFSESVADMEPHHMRLMNVVHAKFGWPRAFNPVDIDFEEARRELRRFIDQHSPPTN